MLLWFPGRLRLGVPTPLDEITDFLFPSNELVLENVLDFEFGFSVYKFRKGRLIRNSVLGGSYLRCKQ